MDPMRLAAVALALLATAWTAPKDWRSRGPVGTTTFDVHIQPTPTPTPEPSTKDWPFVAMHRDPDGQGEHVVLYLKRGPGYRGEFQPVIFFPRNILMWDGSRPEAGEVMVRCPRCGKAPRVDSTLWNLVIVERSTGKRWEPGKPFPERGR